MEACRGAVEGSGLEGSTHGRGRCHPWGRGSSEGNQGLGQGPTGFKTQDVYMYQRAWILTGRVEWLSLVISHHVGHIVDPRTLPINRIAVFSDEVVFVCFRHASI